MQVNLSMLSDTSEALERMKTMQQHMPGLNYSGDKSMRQAVSQPSYIQTGPPVFPEPVPTSTMRHPGPQYFEENRFVYSINQLKISWPAHVIDFGTVNVLKFQTLSSLLSNKMLVIRAGFTKCMSE